MPIGSLVKFIWWSSYKAPSVSLDAKGHVTWHELKPGDKGIVVGSIDEQNSIILFSSVDSLLKLNNSMLEIV